MKPRLSIKLAKTFFAAFLTLWLTGVAPFFALPFSLQESPPQESGPFRAPELVELLSLEPTIHLDIRYATSHNLVGRPVYAEARAFLQRPAAEAVVRVHRSLKKKGLGLLIFIRRR